MTLGDLVRPANEWERVLRESGVLQATLDRGEWGKVFAAKMRPGVFSKGAAELPDFLATILHESAMLTRGKESGMYSEKRIVELGNAAKAGSRWRSLVPRAASLAMNERAFFEACYGGRMGNGPEGSGDGAKYPGRSPIGMTGLDNYRLMAKLLDLDLVAGPTLAEATVVGLDIAVAWWEDKVPDSIIGDRPAIRVCVNGGCIGADAVELLWKKVTRAL